MNRAAAQARVAVLGASPKPDRYSHKAVKMLKEHGFAPIPVHPAGHTVDGTPGVKSLDDISENVDTLSVYVNSRISDQQQEEIFRLNPRRVIFNPGAENGTLARLLEQKGVRVVEACTLVMLRTEQF